jgi:hypothetical protein
MKKVIILSLFSLVAVTACKKDDSVGTTPVITFKSYSSSPVVAANGMDMTFEVKDGDGDIENSLNFAAIYDTDLVDTAFQARPMPGLDNNKGRNLTAEVVLHLLGTDFPQVGTNPVAKDSVHFLVYIQDDAGHISDTIATPKIQVIYQ